ncbi:MAG: glycosyltransferase family 2 protein [Rhodoplanes sp.]
MSERPAVEPPAAIGELSQGLMLHRSAPGDSAHSMDDTGDITAQRLRELEARISKLEANVKTLAAAYSLARHGTRRIWLRPPLWTFEQHAPRPLRIDADYAREQAPADTPSIGIVTPSLNGGRFLAATVDSVLTQNYPSLRYHVQDGGSTDSSCELLRSYGARLTWRSEPDSGQAQAINRAFAEIGDCDIMAYLNSDDMLLSGTLAYVANVFRARPDVDLVYGHRIFVDQDGAEIGRAVLPAHDAAALCWADYVPQETLFWRRRVWQAVGPLDESFHYALDWDFILRAQAAHFKFARLPRFLACFRVHDEQKTAALYDVGREEMMRLRVHHLGYAPNHRQIMRAIAPYLARQFVFHWAYRFGILRF